MKPRNTEGLTYCGVTSNGILGTYKSLSGLKRSFRDCTNYMAYAVGEGKAWLVYSVTDGEPLTHNWERA